jgi:hypothetical protein
LTPNLVALAALVAWIAIAGCAGDAARPIPTTAGIPQASFDGRLDPGASSFVLTRVPGTQPGQAPVEVELIGSNLASDPATGTVSLDVSIRNVSTGELSNPTQVWLSDFTPASIEVLNADYLDPPIRSSQRGTPAGPTRFGFDYASLVGPDDILSPGETSQSRTWQFLVPGLGSFSFAAIATFGGPPNGPVIAGLVFQDLDGDGVRDPDDPPLFGRIALQRPDGTIAATGTMDGGAYSLPVQDVGLHTLTLEPPVLDCACEVVVTTPNPLRVVLLPDGNGQPLSYRHADFGVRIIQLGDPLPVVLTDLSPADIRQDPYRLGDADLTDDILTLRVGFSGCTPFHDFTLFMSGGFMESNPVQARLVLGHDDHGEQCDAAFERTLQFDLAPVRAAYERVYGQPGLVVLQLTDLQGVQHSFRYRWGTPAGQNMLPNGSFERDGQPTLDGWEVNNPALTSLVPGRAPDGGAWALRLEADWAPTTGFVRAPVTGVVPGHSLRLSAWVRGEGDAGGGMIYMTSGPWASEPVVIEAPDWTPVELIAVPRIRPGDTVWVVLSSLHTEIVPRRGLFDNVVLEDLPVPRARR